MTRRRTQLGPRRPAPGFSLFELLVVLAIIATLTALAAPRYSNSLARYRADATVRRIAADLEFAAHRARLESLQIKIRFKKGEDDNYYYFEDYPEPDGSADYTVHLWDDPYRTWMYDAPVELKFDLYGMPDRTDTIFVRAANQVERSVHIDDVTGAITVQ